MGEKEFGAKVTSMDSIVCFVASRSEVPMTRKEEAMTKLNDEGSRGDGKLDTRQVQERRVATYARAYSFEPWAADGWVEFCCCWYWSGMYALSAIGVCPHCCMVCKR